MIETKNLKAVVFDLDGTLSKSKLYIDGEMSLLLQSLLYKKVVCVVSGGSFEQFKSELIIPLGNFDFTNLHLFPTDGTSYYKWNNGKKNWENVYEQKLDENERNEIMRAFDEVFREINFSHSNVYGKLIEDRQSQITFSGLGQDAPYDQKIGWDPDLKIREEIAKRLRSKLPNHQITIAGLTSIDVTRFGLDKAYAVLMIEKNLNIKVEEMLYVGDAIFEGGNDFQVLKTGIPYIKVSSPEDTKQIIKEIIK